MSERTAVHDRTVSFRANADMVASAASLARREGMSLAEFLRSAVRRELKDAA
jgi:hypothetical protein